MLKLDGSVPSGAGAAQDVAIAALTRRVAELERRLDVMKIIVGLVLFGKALLVALFLYVLLGHGFVVQGGAVQSLGEAGVQRLPG